MSRPRKIVPPEEVTKPTNVRLPKWLKDQIELVGNLYPDKATFTDKLIFVVQQGVEKIIKDKELTTYDRIEAMVARTEDMVLTSLALQYLSQPEEYTTAEIEEQKALIVERMRKRRAGRTKTEETQEAT